MEAFSLRGGGGGVSELGDVDFSAGVVTEGYLCPRGFSPRHGICVCNFGDLVGIFASVKFRLKWTVKQNLTKLLTHGCVFGGNLCDMIFAFCGFYVGFCLYAFAADACGIFGLDQTCNHIEMRFALNYLRYK